MYAVQRMDARDCAPGNGRSQSMRTRRSWPGRQPAPVRVLWYSFDIETPSRFSKAHPLAPPQPTLASSDGAALMRGWELMVR